MSYGRVPCFISIFLWFCGLLAIGHAASGSLDVAVAIQSESDPQPLDGFVKSEIHMGVRFQISLYTTDETAAERAFNAGFAEIARLEQVFSDYNTTSETRRIDAAPCDSPLDISPDMLDLLQKSFELNRDTSGYFDVTLGRLTKLWRTSRREQKSPDPEAIQAAALGVGSHLLELTEQRLLKRPPGVELDFGGIAKGYAADQVLRKLAHEFGITRVLIDASGDLIAGDPPPNQKGWVVELSQPADAPGPRLHVYLANRALASSGDSTQFLQTDQVRWSHLLNPHTKTPIIGQNLTLVWANDGATADALASALAICTADEFPIITARFQDLAATAYRRRNLEKPIECLQTENWKMTIEQNQVPVDPRNK